MKRILKYFILMFIIVVFVHKPVFANPAAEQRQNERFEIEEKIEELDMKIEEVMGNIEKNNKQITKIKKDIKITEEDLKQVEEDIKSEQELFNTRVRVMYMNGLGGYLDVIFGANGLSDFISRVQALKSIVKLDKKIMSNIKDKQQNLNNKKQELNKQNNILVALNNESNEKLNKLKADKNEQRKLIEEAKRHERLYASSVEATQTKINETLKRIETEKKVDTGESRPSRGGTVVSSDAVIAYASKFLGTPYLWGGTTPSGFDCSGFTQYVYKHFGIYVGRTTKNQIHDGVRVSRNQLQPGDLVFYGKGGIPSHMGIYIGNGMYIHSPRTGDVVKISPYNRPNYITARRVIR